VKTTKIIFTVLLGLLIGIIIYWIIFPARSPSWFGPYDQTNHSSRAVTLWDILDLLIVPSILVISAWLLGTIEKDAERNIQTDRQRQETLEKYFERMSDLLLKTQLREQPPNSEGRILARTWSLSVFRTLDSARKAEVLQFIYESNLIGKNPILTLYGANLRSCNLEKAVLIEAEIRGAYFTNTKMSGANLKGANLSGSDLRNADLRKAFLEDTDLSFTFLNGANLSHANLSMTKLNGAILKGAILWGSYLTKEQRDVVVLSKTQLILLAFLDVLAFLKKFELKKLIPSGKR